MGPNLTIPITVKPGVYIEQAQVVARVAGLRANDVVALKAALAELQRRRTTVALK
jgi:hypothetical protein